MKQSKTTPEAGINNVALKTIVYTKIAILRWIAKQSSTYVKSDLDAVAQKAIFKQKCSPLDWYHFSSFPLSTPSLESSHKMRAMLLNLLALALSAILTSFFGPGEVEDGNLEERVAAN